MQSTITRERGNEDGRKFRGKRRDETLKAQYRTSADQRRGAKTNRKGNESKMSYGFRIPPRPSNKSESQNYLEFQLHVDVSGIL